MRGSLQQERELHRHHEVQQERSLSTLLRDTQPAVRNTQTSAGNAYVFSAALCGICALLRLEPPRNSWVAVWFLVPQCAFVLLLLCRLLWTCSFRCTDLYHLLCPSARACLSRRVAASEHAVLAENSSAGCEVRQPLCGARQPRRSEPEDD